MKAPFETFKIMRSSEGLGWFHVATFPFPQHTTVETQRMKWLEQAIREKLAREAVPHSGKGGRKGECDGWL